MKSKETKNYSTFVFDIDGTLENSAAKVLPKTIEVLKKAHEKYGKNLIFCTGRPFFDILDLIKELPFFSYAICNNGSYFYNLQTKKFYFNHVLKSEVLNPFIALAKKHDTVTAIHSEKNIYRFRSKQPILPHILADPRHKWNDFPFFEDNTVRAILDADLVTQFSIRWDPKLIESLREQTRVYADRVSMRIAGGDYFDINALGASKLTGLREIGNILNLDVSSFVAFGDSGNDIEMLGGVGLGICMGNGTPEAKAAAKEIIGTNETDAIARRISELLAEEGG